MIPNSTRSKRTRTNRNTTVGNSSLQAAPARLVGAGGHGRFSNVAPNVPKGTGTTRGTPAATHQGPKGHQPIQPDIHKRPQTGETPPTADPTPQSTKARPKDTLVGVHPHVSSCGQRRRAAFNARRESTTTKHAAHVVARRTMVDSRESNAYYLSPGSGPHPLPRRTRV